MKKFILPVLFSFVMVSLFSSCAKIKQKRLEGKWELTNWKIATDTTSVRVLTQHADVLPYDRIVVEFLKDNVLIVSTFKQGEFKFSEESFWAENEKFDKLAFPDSIFLFSPDVLYKIEHLSRTELTLNGRYTIAGITYSDVTWDLDKK